MPPKNSKTSNAQTPAAPPIAKPVLIALCAAFVFGVAALGFRPVFDNDIGIHVGIGRTIWQTHAVSGIDNHSHTAPNAPFLDHEWLARVVFYGLDRLGGVVALVTFQGLLVLLTFALLGWTYRDRPLAVAFGLLLAGIVLSTRVQVRPHVMAWVFIAAQIAFMRRKAEWAVALLLALWANVHASFLLGLLMALIHVAERWWDDRDPRLFAWAAAFVVAPMINPFGPRIYAFAGQIKDINFFVSEWQPYGWDSGFWWIIIVFFTLLAVDIARRREHRLFDAARLALLGYLSHSAMRHGSESMLYAVPIFADRYGPMSARIKPAWKSVIAGVLAVGAVGGGLYLAFDRKAFRFDVDLYALPVKAVEFVDRTRPDSELFNDYNFGGYLLWKLDPPRKVFVDGRLEVYGAGGQLDEYLRVSNGVPGWQRILDKYRVNTCVVRADRPIAKQLDDSGQWDLAYFDYNSAVFLRHGTSPWIRRITCFRPWGHRDRNNFPVLVDEAHYVLRLNPLFFGGYKLLAFVLYRTGDYAGARDNMREYLRLYPDGMDSKQTRDMLGNLSLRGFGIDTRQGNAGAVVPRVE